MPRADPVVGLREHDPDGVGHRVAAVGDHGLEPLLAGRQHEGAHQPDVRVEGLVQDVAAAEDHGTPVMVQPDEGDEQHAVLVRPVSGVDDDDVAVVMVIAASQRPARRVSSGAPRHRARTRRSSRLCPRPPCGPILEKPPPRRR